MVKAIAFTASIPALLWWVFPATAPMLPIIVFAFLGGVLFTGRAIGTALLRSIDRPEKS